MITSPHLNTSRISPRKALIVVVIVLNRGSRACRCRHSAASALPKLRSNSTLTPWPRPLLSPFRPSLARLSDDLVLPGNVTAYTDSPIYARTSGYLVHWYYDIGANVKKGALLAVIATPELDQQLAQAEADLATAQANANNAKIQASRYKDLVKSNAVSQQDTDTFVNQAASTSAAVRSAQANVQRLVELQSFEKVYAPFDGVVTARNVDTGQLINQGADQPDCFTCRRSDVLRVYTNVPQLRRSAQGGDKIRHHFPEHPGKSFRARWYAPPSHRSGQPHPAR